MLQSATEADRPLIRAMVQEYLAELSQFDDIKTDDSGYVYPYFDFYWHQPDRHPYLIVDSSEVAGFLLARADQDPENGSPLMEIAELYILPPFRQRGLASDAVLGVWQQFPGTWRVGVLPGNRLALDFWLALISATDPSFRELSTTGASKKMREFQLSAGLQE
jgi:predicted acetyltransferase